MAGLKGRSGPPRNLNAAKHGLTTWLRRRALPLNRQHVGKMVGDYEESLIRCKGGSESISEVELALVRNAGLARGACLLVLEESAARGLTRQTEGGSWDLSPGFGRLLGFLGAERQALVALGMERRARDVESLADILATSSKDQAVARAPAGSTTLPFSGEDAP